MVDLRSDTLSMPTKEMLKTILEAKLGDDGRTDLEGRGEDRAVNELEDLAAQMTGKEAGILFPSGTQGNTAAVLAHCKTGERVMVDEQQHILLSEKVLFDPAIGRLEPTAYKLDQDCLPDLRDMRRILKEEEIHLLCIENTHNFSGGTCVPLDRMKAIHALAEEFGIPVHMDGARLFNASAALGTDVRLLCQYVDSVMFCLSKGLGAPVGSLVCCSREFSMKVREKRKLLGGSMRQAGIIAAPGIYALTHNTERLKEDHANAAFAEKQLRELKNTVICGTVMSNIIVLDPGGLGITAEEYCKRAAKKGLLIKPVLRNKVRLVFYKDITREDTKQAVRIIRELDVLN